MLGTDILVEIASSLLSLKRKTHRTRAMMYDTRWLYGKNGEGNHGKKSK